MGQNTRPRLGRHYKLHSKGCEYWEGPLIQLIYHGAPSRKEKWACVDQGSDCKSHTKAALSPGNYSASHLYSSLSIFSLLPPLSASSAAFVHVIVCLCAFAGTSLPWLTRLSTSGTSPIVCVLTSHSWDRQAVDSSQPLESSPCVGNLDSSLHYFVRAAVTKYHRLGGLINRRLFSHSSGD